MRRFMTVLFFTNKVVQQYKGMWEEEMDLVLKDLYRDERASVEGGSAIETTLWSMEWAIAELVNHPHIQNKLRDEILTILEWSPLTESHLHRPPYLQAVVKETLRLHTPVPLLVPHMNLEEAKLNGDTIPEGSKVVVNGWWLASNPEWFLEEESGTDAGLGGRADFRYLPFGVGWRSCPGIILALPIIGIDIGNWL
ncbi:hypothetical protein MRB53_029899 [Persea americana]|uniref:Uncharacterized protein n=1 Tax=Persea americana TaxID=3435 RepID=A0ACC2KK39_PERAE|nr:hypothetical protein MRB53_029899 [Persea americana]